MAIPLQSLLQFHTLFNERGETDERAIAIVGATFLDNILEKLLASFLVDDAKECQKLLSHDQSMGTFGSRVTAGYCLGLICKTVRDDLRIVGKIRNRFAHELSISFDTDPVRGWCHDLRWHEFTMMMRAPDGAKPRAIFEVSVNQLIAHLNGLAELARARRCKIDDPDRGGPTLLR